MGMMAKSVSIARYHTDTALPPAAELFSEMSRLLAAKAFSPIDDTDDEISSGWVHFFDKDEWRFAASKDLWVGDYLCFSFRQDRRKVPASLVKKLLAKETNKYLAANPGKKRVPKETKEELKEKIMRSLLKKTLPVPTAHDVVWNIRNGRIFFCNLAAGTMDHFETLFRSTFRDRNLKFVTPMALAESLVEADACEVLRRENQAASEAVVDIISSNTWIGYEFLLWLLYNTLNGSSEYRVATGGILDQGAAFTAYVDRKLKLVAKGSDAKQQVVVTGTQGKYNEVRMALQEGKDIAEAAIIFEREENEWQLVLRGETFHFAAMKPPALALDQGYVDAEAEEVAAFLEKMHTVETGVQLFESLFADFLKERLGVRWGELRQGIDTWVRSGDAA